MKKAKSNRERGTGTIFKNRNYFYLKVRSNGKTKVTKLLDQNDQPITTRPEAEAAAALLNPILRATQKEEIALYVASAKKLARTRDISIDKIWTTFMMQSSRPDSGEVTLDGYKKILNLFLKWLGEAHPEINSVSQISSEIAMEYFNHIWENDIAARSYNSRRQALKLIFKHIYEMTSLEKNPFENIKGKTGVCGMREAFTEEEVQKIFSGFKTGFFYDKAVEGFGRGRERGRGKERAEFIPLHKEEMFVLLNLCCWTGCRGQDGCLMQWSNVDMVRKTISYIPIKTARKTGYKSVTLPMHPQLYEALRQAESWRKENEIGEDYILPKVARRYQYNHSGVQHDVIKIIKYATGLETTVGKKALHHKIRSNRYSLHSFRHTFVSFCANAGVPLDVVASIVGHGSSAMTRHYAHISHKAKDEAIQALPVIEYEKEESESKEELLKKLSALSEEELLAMIKNKSQIA